MSPTRRDPHSAPRILEAREGKNVSTLIELAEGVWQLPLLPMNGLNAYLIGDVVVDAGLPWSEGRLLSALEDRAVCAHVLTHAHPDHEGASAALCKARQVPLWCGARDREAAEHGTFSQPVGGSRRRLFQVAERLGGDGHRVARTLREGDAVGAFRVLETPGHTPGHISLWREEDGVLILGDVASHQNPLSLSLGLREPSRLFTADPDENRRSIARVAALAPRLVCFGHGPPLADGDRFVRWAERLGA
jgi:glyoxylase-like metal-dependent hydrolase (beta-lactamase superfamily II)